MTIDYFLKFIRVIGVKNIKIKYFEYDEIGVPFPRETFIEDIDLNYRVCAYLMLLDDNEVHVFFSSDVTGDLYVSK